MLTHSLLDNDFYKFTMAQAVFHQYPDAWVKYKFKCRNPQSVVLPKANEIYNVLCDLCSLKLSEVEIAWLNKTGLFKPSFINFLKLLQLNINFVKIEDDPIEGLKLEIEGPWFLTIFFEVPILAIISELSTTKTYGEKIHYDILLNDWYMKNNKFYTKIPIADFGTRRRFSFAWHKTILQHMVNCKQLNVVGSSNMYFAKYFDLKPIGTMAHEWLQAHQQLGPRVVDSQKAALDAWAREYRGSLGIALTDVINMDSFLNDFDLYSSKLFDGCRHDSGDPIQWCYKLIDHYQNLGIDPMTKTAVFSDGLTFESAYKIYEIFKRKIRLSFGVGTFITNSIEGHIAPQNVIKMVECNGKPVAKISDEPNKNMCEDEEYLSYLRKVFDVPGKRQRSV